MWRCTECPPVPEEVRRTADLLERRYALALIYAAANDLSQAAAELTLALKVKPDLADREEVKRLRQQLTGVK